MKIPSFGCRKFPIVAAALLALLFAVGAARAQNSSQDELKVTPSAGDRAAALSSKTIYRHARAANNETGKGLRARETAQKPGAASSAASHDGGIVRFPGDVTYQGGAVVDFAASHAVYLLPNGS
jgi:beta-lactamase class A